jgi:uncharacterized membrane protein YfhO
VAALRPIRSGTYDVYAVREPATIVTFPRGDAAASEVGNQRIVATGQSDGGDAVIRRNWFPRWRATVNGEPAPIERREDGYMAVPVPPGQARIELVYAVDALDWLARGAALAGIVAVAVAVAGTRFRRRPATRLAG